VFHPQLGVDATLGQSLSGTGQQRMGRDPGSPEQATHLQAPALLEGGAGGETKGGGALQLALQLQHAPAGFGGRTQVGLKATAKPHALGGIGAVQKAQWVAGTRGGCAEAKQEQEAKQAIAAFKAAGVLTLPLPPIITLEEKRKAIVEFVSQAPAPASSQPAQEKEQEEEEEFPDNAETERIANLVFPDAGGYNWEGLSELLLKRLEAPPGALFPESDDEQW
jgi:hypothetical protein